MIWTEDYILKHKAETEHRLTVVDIFAARVQKPICTNVKVLIIYKNKIIWTRKEVLAHEGRKYYLPVIFYLIFLYFLLYYCTFVIIILL